MHLRHCMKELIIFFTKVSLKNFKPYIKQIKMYSNQENPTDMHLIIMKELIEENFNKQRRGGVADMLDLVKWLLDTINRKRQQRRREAKNYKKLITFLEDLIVTLLVLKILMCRNDATLPGQTQNDSQSQPMLTITPHVITPENSLFQQLILTQMLRILGQQIPENHDPVSLARVVVQLPDRRKEARLQRIVKDQARYLTFRSPYLQSNFVAYKTGYYLRNNVFLNDEQRTRLTTELERKMIKTEDDSSYIKFLLNLEWTPSDDQLPVIRTKKERRITKKERAVINAMYHEISNNLTLDVLGDCHPQIKADGSVGVSNYNHFIITVAQKLVKQGYPSTEQEKRYIANKVIQLQQIILLRSSVSDMLETITRDDCARKHQELLFILIAFRALLIYILPTNLYSLGVQQVAKELPKYAKNWNFIVQPEIVDEMFADITVNNSDDVHS